MTNESTETLPAGEPPVGGDADAGVSGGDDELRQLPDQVLQGSLQRMQRSVAGGIIALLPDGGRAYCLKLLAIRQELERRQAAALSAQPTPSSSSQLPLPRDRNVLQGERLDDEQHEPARQPGCAESSDIRGTSSLPAQMETPVCPSKELPEAPIIKPKLEPCEDSPSPAPDGSADCCDTTPLSGSHPFFTIVLSRSQVQKPFQLCIPGRFHKHLPEARTAATLICRGKSWPMSYCGNLKVKRLDADWMHFAVNNGLQVNDACVFELLTGTREEVVFQVQILRGGLPEEITSKGATADEPLVIVD